MCYLFVFAALLEYVLVVYYDQPRYQQARELMKEFQVQEKSDKEQSAHTNDVVSIMTSIFFNPIGFVVIIITIKPVSVCQWISTYLYGKLKGKPSSVIIILLTVKKRICHKW